MTVITTGAGVGINLDHITHWATDNDGRRRFHLADDSSIVAHIGTEALDRAAATAVPAPAGYELIRRYTDDGSHHRQPVVMLYVDVVVGLIDAAGIDDHLSDAGQHLITPDGQVFALCEQMWPTVEVFLADIEVPT